MRVAMAVGMMLLVMNLNAAEKVLVYVDNREAVDNWTLYVAEHLATGMFARIGVSIKWRRGTAPRGETMATVVHVLPEAPDTLFPNALGYTTFSPNSGPHVFVLANRVRRASDFPFVPTLLAHVVAHEVTHALEGISRHAETGVMKARWSGEDFSAMAHKPLEFTPVDVNIIHSRLAQR